MSIVLPGSRDRQVNIFNNGSPDGRLNPARPLALTTLVNTELTSANPGWRAERRVTFYDFFGDDTNPRIVATPMTMDIENAQDPYAVTRAVQGHMAMVLSSGYGGLPADYREGQPVSEQTMEELIGLLESPDTTTQIAQ